MVYYSDCIYSYLHLQLAIKKHSNFTNRSPKTYMMNVESLTTNLHDECRMTSPKHRWWTTVFLVFQIKGVLGCFERYVFGVQSYLQTQGVWKPRVLVSFGWTLQLSGWQCLVFRFLSGSAPAQAMGEKWWDQWSCLVLVKVNISFFFITWRPYGDIYIYIPAIFWYTKLYDILSFWVIIYLLYLYI